MNLKKSILADIIKSKDFVRRQSRNALNSMTRVVITDRKEEDTDREEDRPCEDGDRDWSEAATKECR